MAKEKLEHARITLRKYRDEVISDIDKKEKEGGMGKDEHFKLKQEVQKIVDEVNKKLSDQFEKKEKEIMS
jgi:ribosome recycling factor